MKKAFIAAVSALAVAIAACVALRGASPAAAGSGTESATVFVSIPPLRGLVSDLLPADAAEVKEIVPAGASPEQFEPSPADVRALSGARLLFAVGENFESAWLGRVQAQMPELRVVHLGDGLATLRFGEEGEEHHHHHEGELADHDDDDDHEHGDLDEHHHHHDGEHADHEHHHHDGEHVDHEHHHHHHDGADPHIWTDPHNLVELSRRAAAELKALFPERSAEIDSNLARVEAKYADLDKKLAELFAPHAGRAILVFHPAWGYLCHRYGLKQVAVEEAGHAPAPRTLAKTIEFARAEKIAAIFVAAQTDRRVAASISQELGVPTVVLDPLAPDLAASLAGSAQAIAQALGAKGAE